MPMAQHDETLQLTECAVGTLRPWGLSQFSGASTFTVVPNPALLHPPQDAPCLRALPAVLFCLGFTHNAKPRRNCQCPPPLLPDWPSYRVIDRRSSHSLHERPSFIGLSPEPWSSSAPGRRHSEATSLKYITQHQVYSFLNKVMCGMVPSLLAA